MSISETTNKKTPTFGLKNVKTNFHLGVKRWLGHGRKITKLVFPPLEQKTLSLKEDTFRCGVQNPSL